MLKKKLELNAFCLLMAASFNAYGEVPKRISGQFVDLGQVFRIYLSPGLASSVQLPTPISEFYRGSADDLEIQVSKVQPSRIGMRLPVGRAKPTNLIIHCGKKTFVFDIIPSHSIHQDYIKIVGGYGSPEVSESGLTLVDSSISLMAPKHKESQVGQLIDSSDGWQEIEGNPKENPTSKSSVLSSQLHSGSGAVRAE